MKTSMGAKTIVYPTPVFVVGSYDSEGNPNVMTAAWGGICCSVPPCVTVSLREATHTYHNILASKAFTVSIPSDKNVKEADYFGIASGKDTDKFKNTGLTAASSKIVNAPYVSEFPFILECELIQTVKIGLHTQFIGQILDIKVDEKIMEGDEPLIKKISPMIYSPDDLSYYGVGDYLGKAFSVGKEIKD
jgi:flavin reductase (DIM6/NTAB) family NADH-FMN oxidoreductase RutF